MFDSLRRWTGEAIPEEPPPIDVTVAAMDAADVRFGLLSAWHGPGGPLIANDEVAGWIEQHPDRFAGLAAVDLNRPMDAVRELRRCVTELGFLGLRVIPWLWEAPPTDRRYYPLYAACVELGVPFCTQVGHTGPLKPSETGRPIPYIDQVAIDFPELTIVCGHIGYPWTEEMVAVARKHERVYIDTSAYTARRYPPELVAYLRTSERQPQGHVRLQLPDDRAAAGARAPPRSRRSTTRRRSCSSTPTPSGCSACEREPDRAPARHQHRAAPAREHAGAARADRGARLHRRPDARAERQRRLHRRARSRRRSRRSSSRRSRSSSASTRRSWSARATSSPPRSRPTRSRCRRTRRTSTSRSWRASRTRTR